MIPAWILTSKDRIDRIIKDFFDVRYRHPKDAVEAHFFDAVRYAVEGGGKRLRTILAITAYEYASKHPVSDKTIESLIGIEMMQAYTLVHDDLPSMDNDTMRRGKPTVWKKYGETIAILVGDSLNTMTFELLAGLGDVRIVAELARALGDMGVVRGQVRDTLLSHDTLEIDELLRIHDEKAGGFIATSLVIGGLLAKADERILGQLREFGNLLGRAFQIKDDILDYEGDAILMGKNTKKDIALKKGIVAGMDIDNAKIMLHSIQKEIKKYLDIFQYSPFNDIVDYSIYRQG